MLRFEATSVFRRDVKRAIRRGRDMSQLETVVSTLLSEQPLDAKYRDHALSGNMSRYRECHIQPDWLLIYRVEKQLLVLVAHRTGTHADLFDE